MILLERIHARAPRRRGFTLIEVLSVVVITAILAVVALGSFQARMATAGNARVKAQIKTIAAAQESYRAEHLVYLDVSGTNLNNLYPTTSPDGTIYNFWQSTGSALEDNWERLGPQMPTEVTFAFATTAGLPSAAGVTFPTVAAELGTVTWPTPTEPWYVIQAVGDDDGDGTRAVALASSFGSRVIWSNEEE